MEPPQKTIVNNTNSSLRKWAHAVRKLSIVILIIVLAAGTSGCMLLQARRETPAAPAPPAAPGPSPARQTPPAKGLSAPAPAPGPAQVVRDLRQVSMFSSTAGWALSESKVLSTQDGGATWSDVTPKGLSSLSGAASFFLDGGHAWLVTAGDLKLTVFRTTDSGRTWTQSRGPDAMGAIMRFWDEKTGLLVAHLGAAMSHEEVSIFRTEDGGATWKLLSHTPIDKEMPGALPLTGIKSGLAMLGSDRGWVTGSWPVPGKPYLFATKDGGKTWSAVVLPLPKEYAGEMMTVEPPVFSVTGREGVMAANLYGEGRITLFFSTSDRGETWQYRGKLKSGGDRFFLSIAGPGSLHALDGERLYASTDAGKSWTQVTPAAKLTDVTSVQFISEQAGWVASGGQLLKTVDGGKTWSAARN